MYVCSSDVESSNCWCYVTVWIYIISIILQNKWHYVVIRKLLSLLYVWRLLHLQVAYLINRVSIVQNCHINQKKGELRFSWRWMLRLLLIVFWVVTLFSLVVGCLHFRGYQEDVGRKSLQNVGICLPKSVTSQPRRM
jgi:hypothetical protein